MTFDPKFLNTLLSPDLMIIASKYHENQGTFKKKHLTDIELIDTHI